MGIEPAETSFIKRDGPSVKSSFAGGYCALAEARPLRFNSFHSRSPRKYCQRPCSREIMCNCRQGKCLRKQ